MRYIYYQDLYYSDYLEHHGIKGQRWGIRRTAAQLGPVLVKSAKVTGKAVGKVAGATAKGGAKAGKKLYGYEKTRHEDKMKRERLAKASKNFKKGKIDRLTDDELRELETRERQKLNIENYRRQRKEIEMNPAQKFARSMGQKAIDGLGEGIKNGVSIRTSDYIKNYAVQKVSKITDENSKSAKTPQMMSGKGTKITNRIGSRTSNPSSKIVDLTGGSYNRKTPEPMSEVGKPFKPKSSYTPKIVDLTGGGYKNYKSTGNSPSVSIPVNSSGSTNSVALKKKSTIKDTARRAIALKSQNNISYGADKPSSSGGGKNSVSYKDVNKFLQDNNKKINAKAASDLKTANSVGTDIYIENLLKRYS